MDWRVKYRPYIVAATLGFALTMFVAPEVNEGNFMKPTLDNGQVTVVVKKSYSENRGLPEPGTVVCMEKVYSRATSEDNLIGRVVGLPGDTIKIKDGKIYRNGEEIADAGMAEEGKFELKENQGYLLSDNSKSDIDSRNSDLGVIDIKEIKGDVKLKVWPLSDFGLVK